MLLIITIVLLWIACAAAVIAPVLLWCRISQALDRLDLIELWVRPAALNDNEPPPDHHASNVTRMPRGKGGV